MNPLKARSLTENDYPILAEWWKFWWEKPVLREVLPDDISNGVLIYNDNTPICAGFIYQTSSSSLYWIEFIISSNKVRDKELRDKALHQLLKVLLKLCKDSGAKTVFSSVKHKTLIEKYMDNGFIKGDDGMLNLIYNFK